MPDIAVGAIIVAAGSSGRMLGTDKLFAEIAGRPLLAHTIAAFERCDAIQRIVVVLSAQNVERGRDLISDHDLAKVRAVCEGGSRRQDSVRRGLEALGRCDYVAVHDGARPLVTRELIERGIAAACEAAAAVAAVPLADTIKEANSDGTIQCTLDRRRLYAAQTPQVFRYDILLRAHREISDDVTDDAAMLEALGVPVKLFDGDRRNIKVTMAADLGLAEALIAGVVNLN